MVALGVDDWLSFILVVDRIYGKFVFFPPMSRGRILEGFMVNKRDSRVMGSFNMVILTSHSIHERLVAL
jgi:hypothetical protein